MLDGFTMPPVVLNLHRLQRIDFVVLIVTQLDAKHLRQLAGSTEAPRLCTAALWEYAGYTGLQVVSHDRVLRS